MNNTFNNVKQSVDDINKVIESVFNFVGLKDSELLKKIQIEVTMNADLSISVVAPEYITFVDNGRKAGKMPPFKNVYEWVLKNRNKLKFDSKSSGRNGDNENEDNHLKSVTYAIMKNIALKGTKGYFFMDKLIQEVFNLVIANVSKDIDNVLTDIVNTNK